MSLYRAPVVDQLESLEPVPGSEAVEPAVEPEVPEEPAVETAAARTARRQYATLNGSRNELRCLRQHFALS